MRGVIRAGRRGAHDRRPRAYSEGVTLLLREVRPVRVTSPAPAAPVDVRVADGRVAAVAARLHPQAGDEVLAGGGRWLLPGLWDQHVHLAQWVTARSRLDTSRVGSVEEALALVRERLSGTTGPVVGFGHRCATWASQPTTAHLDAVTDRPVILISGDAHHGWLSSAGRRLVGLPPGEQIVAENDWFPAFDRLGDVIPLDEATYAAAVRHAATRGIVGVTDLEFAGGLDDWPRRHTAGLDTLRVRVGIYPPELDRVLDAGLRTGQPLTSDGFVTMGPLKVITDGSLGSSTAHCAEPYADPSGGMTHGRQNVSRDDLTALLTRAAAAGLEAAVHAIGDAAVGIALDAFMASRAAGSIEHAQLVGAHDLERMSALGITAGVQPAHLLDDRDLLDARWADRGARCFAFRSMRRHGVELVLGSDAPVSPLDPWLAMAAAVHRSGDDRDPWHPSEALTPTEAVAASADGQGTVEVGSRGDLVLLDADPLARPAGEGEIASAPAARVLRDMRVAATVVDGRVVHDLT